MQTCNRTNVIKERSHEVKTKNSFDSQQLSRLSLQLFRFKILPGSANCIQYSRQNFVCQELQIHMRSAWEAKNNSCSMILTLAYKHPFGYWVQKKYRPSFYNNTQYREWLYRSRISTVVLYLRALRGVLHAWFHKRYSYTLLQLPISRHS